MTCINVDSLYKNNPKALASTVSNLFSICVSGLAAGLALQTVVAIALPSPPPATAYEVCNSVSDRLPVAYCVEFTKPKFYAYQPTN